MDGVLNFNKPIGPTSHDMVSRLRRITGEKRIGHTGTLDPDASGVMVICIGKATRIVEYLTEWKKSYRAVAVFGRETDSEDASGNVTQIQDCSHLTQTDIGNVLPRFIGDIMQVPPMISALHYNGKRLYELARAGEVVEREPRPVTIHSLKLLDFQPGVDAQATLEIECSKGTYIRTLCADIGKALGCGAHMGSLVRTAVGDFDLESAVTLDDIECHTADGTIEDILLSINDAIHTIPAIIVSTKDALRIANGIKLNADALYDAASSQLDLPIRIIEPTGDLVAIGRFLLNDENQMILKPDKVFAGY
ncbi:MAG: tRNA pseudouridine(55) synthase TruB [Armatimonadota bacterium]